jgi:hypothetical protein
MKKLKIVSVVFVMLILALTIVKGTTVQASNEMQTFFSKDYAGISIKVNATREAVPGGNMTIMLWAKCTADSVDVEYLTLGVYGFRYGQDKILLNSTRLLENFSPDFNDTSQFNYTVHVPSDVWDATYAELHLKYAIVGTPFEYNPSFSVTIVRNVYLEELENMFQNMNATYWQLNSTFWESFHMNLTAENLALLNETYWGLQVNYTALQGSLNDLDNTRKAVAIFAVTTVFFVATTVYVTMRKPKQYW